MEIQFLLRNLRKILVWHFRRCKKNWIMSILGASSLCQLRHQYPGNNVLLQWALFFALLCCLWFNILIPIPVTKLTSGLLHSSQHFSPHELYWKDYCAKCWQCPRVFAVSGYQPTPPWKGLKINVFPFYQLSSMGFGSTDWNDLFRPSKSFNIFFSLGIARRVFLCCDSCAWDLFL